MNSEKIGAIFERFAAKNPHPETELQYINSYTLLVAVVLSAQATDIGVNKTTHSLFAKVDSPQKMVELGLENLKQYIKTIGLFNTKAKNVIALSKILIEKYQGQIPQTREELETLPGVGRKTANVVLNVAFGQPTIDVDTHIFRVANRTGLAAGKTPLAIELELNSVIPSSYLLHAHHWLILHGRYICKAQKPLCSQCLINDLCEFPGKIIYA